MSAITGVRYVLKLTLLLVLLGLCLMWWSVSSDAGSKRILAATESRLQNVSYEYVSGNLLDGLILSEAHWQLKNGTVISAKGLNLDSNHSCWKSKELCINSGTIEQLTIGLPLKEIDKNEITLKNLSLLLSIQANSISVKELVITHPTRPPIKFNNAEFSGSINDSNITLQQFNTEWNKLYLQGGGTLTMQNDYPISMQGTARRAMRSGILQADWSADGTLKSLNIDANFNKPFNANLNGVLSLLDRRIPANMNLQWDSIALPFDDETPELQLTAGKIEIGGTWPQYTTHGKANMAGPNMPSGTVDLNGTISTKALNFAPLTINTLDGSILGEGIFSWNNNIQWAASVDARDLKPQQRWPEFVGLINATTALEGALTNAGSELRFNKINAIGELNGYPLTANGDVTKDTEQRWRLNNLQLKTGNNNVSAHGTVGDSVKLVFSLLSADSLLPGAIGDIHGDLTVTNSITKPTVTGSITTASFQYKNIDLKNAKIKGNVRNLGVAHSDVEFQAQSVTINDRVLDELDVSLKGSLSDHLIRFNLSSDPIDSVELKIAGAVDEYYNWNGSVSSANSNVANRSLTLVNPFTATWINESQTIAVQPHCWMYDFASVCVKESALIGKTGVVQFELRRLPLESIKEFIPDDITLSGNLESSGNLSWGPHQKTSVTLDSYLEDATAQINKTLNNNKLQMNFPVAKLSVTTEGYKIKSKLLLESDKFSTLTANVVIDTALKSLPILGTVNLEEGQLSWIRDFLPDINLLDGKLNGEALVSGSLFDPQINALLRLQDGKIQSALLPIDIKDIDIGVDIAGNNAKIEGGALANNKSVSLKGKGSITQDGFSSDLNLTGTGIEVKHKYAKYAVLSPDLNFKIRPNNIDITGTVDLSSAQIQIKSITTDGVALSKDVMVIDEQNSNTNSNAQIAVGSTGINTRINIALGNDVSVDAMGLNADLKGNFQFKLDAEKPPALLGAITVSDGSYKAYGQDLKIRDGNIIFTGPIEQTAVSVEAVREIKGLLAGVHIGGTVTNPTTRLFSEPSIPEEDILPFIVLGRKANFGSGDTDLMRKAALMLGVGTGQKVSSKLAQNLGIDDFSLSAWGTGDDTELLVSGRLNDRLLLRYGVGVFKNSNSLYLRYDLADRFYLETSSQVGLESAVDLYYSFDF